MAPDDEADFRAFVEQRGHDLLRTAVLLCGDRGHAEDVLQNALLSLSRTWPRLRDRGAAEAYVRRSLVNGRTDRWRRRGNREHPVASWPDRPLPDQMTAVDDRDFVMRALATLPPRERAVVVLRYYADLSEAATAAALGCSVGTVKSQASSGLARLRRHEDLCRAARPAAKERR